jgi:HSP20 family protein
MTFTRITHDPAMRMIMKNFMNQEQETERRCRWMPATNISQDDQAFHIEMAVPGFSREDIKITVEEDVLKIFSERNKEEANKENAEKSFTMREFGHRDFCRSFSLNEKIDQDGIRAEYSNGILSLTLPRKKEVKSVKEIQIA